MADPTLPQQPPAPTGNWQSQLAPIVGALGGLRGNTGFAKRWAQLEEQDRQRKTQQTQLGMQQQQLGFQRDANTRAGEANTRANQDQLIQQVGAIRQLLGDETITDPEQYNQREAFALNLAPRMGVDTGFVQSLRPAPDTFTKRKIKAVYDKFEKLPQGEREAFEASGMWNINGQPYTPAQARQALGFGGVNAQGQPFAFTAPPPKPDAVNTPEERIANALRSGDTATVKLEEDALRRVGEARRQPGDPELKDIQKQIAEMRLQQMQQSGLSPRVQSAVGSQAKGWDSLPIVKTTQKQAEAVSFSDSLDPNTKNPADDQALIYAFAKAMDPDSVVREGEYATVQKYAQSWAESFGFNAARIFSNTTFLTSQARANMKKTIRARYMAGKSQYDNVRRSYAQKINKLTGQQDGEQYLTDYGGGFPADAAAPKGGQSATKIGRFDVVVEP